jgi:hypothetical protein
VTVDTVNTCTLTFPGDIGYFAAGGSGFATNQNVLWGDWFIVNTAQSFAQGSTLVHIEAARGSGLVGTGNYPGDPRTNTANQYTFYGRYVGWTAVDNREPLASTFATRFLNGGPFAAGTSLLCWRDSKTNQHPFTCPATTGRPPWFPLSQEGVVIFDEQEHPVTQTAPPVSPPPPGTILLVCPAETQRVQVGGASLPVPFNFGWLYLDLNTTILGNPNPSTDPDDAQAWVVSTYSANGRFSVGIDAIRLDSVCFPPGAQHFVP